MYADVAFCDDDEPAPPSRIFDVIFRCMMHDRFRERVHAHPCGKIVQACHHQFAGIQQSLIAAVAVYHQMFAEVLHACSIQH